MVLISRKSCKTASREGVLKVSRLYKVMAVQLGVVVCWKGKKADPWLRTAGSETGCMGERSQTDGRDLGFVSEKKDVVSKLVICNAGGSKPNQRDSEVNVTQARVPRSTVLGSPDQAQRLGSEI